MAKEISNWVIQIITGMEELDCLRPDRSRGDRASVERYDIHTDLKGPEKSPSIACVGITSNLQGKRADILIADDIESQKNSMTSEMRERLVHLSRDFTSICSDGDIIYLGTPQSIDSVYNGLPARGYDVRIWPGRFPTAKEIENYGEFLAPRIRAQLEHDPSLATGGGLTGQRGKPTDSILLGEDVLLKKEIDQGAAYFQLQHMLDTRLSDEERFPLKVGKVIFMNLQGDTVPTQIGVLRNMANMISTPTDYPLADKMYRAESLGNVMIPYQGTHMYVDPAGGGQNGDETAYCVTKFSAGKVFIVDIGGVKGGLDMPSMDELTLIAEKHKPEKISIEKNYGNGALSSVWKPLLWQKHVCDVEDVWESGQKELRIIDTLEPLLGSGRLVCDEELIEQDWADVQRHPAERRSSFSLFAQMAKITRARGSLFHDDRLDALAGSVRNWIQDLAQDEERATEAARQENYQTMMQNPLGDGRPLKGWQGMHGLSQKTSTHSRLNRRW